MVILLELIFQGFFEWVYSLILECWNFFFSSLLDIMTLDFAYIKTHVPVVEDIMEAFLAVGWALLLGNLVFQAIRSMVSGLGFEGEDPKLLFARTFVFSFLLLASPQICEIGLNLTSRIMDLLEIPDAIDVHLVDSGVFGTLTAAWLQVIIFDIIIMFKVLKLLLEVAERYVILAVLTITAPLPRWSGRLARRRQTEQVPPQLQPPAVRKRWLVRLARVVRLVQLAPPELLEGFSGSADSEAERSRPVQQKAARAPTSSTAPAGSGGTIAPPGPAGTGHTSYSGDILRFRDRSPSPARRELPRGAIPGGVFQKDGTPRVHSRPTGTGGRSPALPQRSTNPARQEQVKPPASDSPPVKGGGPTIHTGPAGTSGSPPVGTSSPPKQRSSSPTGGPLPAKQEQAKPPEPAGLPVQGGGPVPRPGPAGTVKGPPAPKRSTRAKFGGLEQGGTHGKPRQ